MKLNKKRFAGVPLCERELLFIAYYLDKNGDEVQAARAAGYLGDDQALINQIGSLLLNPLIFDSISAGLLSGDDSQGNWLVTEEYIIQRMAFIVMEDKRKSLRLQNKKKTAKNIFRKC